MGSDARDDFLRKLQELRKDTMDGPSFKGKAHALRALRRVSELSALRK